MNTNTTTKRTAPRKLIGALAATAGLVAIAAGGLASPAFAHGTSDNPKSRVLGCYEAGVNTWPGGNSEFEGCNEAYEISGESVFSNWNQVVIGDTRQGEIEPQYRDLIPDGQMCAAGDPTKAGLDAASKDWPTTALPAGEEFTLQYLATAVHNPYTFSYYVTKDGYDASKALTWDDLESTPFLVADSVDPAYKDGRGGMFEFTSMLPEKSGEHVIYTIWQGNIKKDGSVQSNEAFFACSNVVFS
ncbi:lytic polysaccharide monooxygenase [Plantibacter flavus]|uniref:lytic polysaccharide monooxygenase n=1 Tax=Plantibacter flavus TaxID=150123 RepID=UPI003F13A8E6